jgi:hypothetical protein
MIACGGCYERVVGASGIGASASTVEPSYRSNTAADRAFDGMVETPRPPSRSKRWVDPGSKDPGSKSPGN